MAEDFAACYAAGLEDLPFPCALVDDHRIVQWVNDAFAAAAAMPAAALVGRSLDQCCAGVAGSPAAPAPQGRLRFHAGGSPRQQQWHWQMVDLPVSGWRLLLLAAGDQPPAATVLASLVEALCHCQASFANFFTNNPLPMWVYDLESLRFLAVNDTAVLRYGYSRAEFLAMTIKDIRPAEDVQRLLANVAQVTEGLDDAGIWQHQKKDGTIIQVEITSHTLIYKGRRAELVVARDVSDLLQTRAALETSEIRFRQLFEHMSCGVAVFKVVGDGDDFIFADWNRAAEDIEQRRWREVVGRLVTEVFPASRHNGFLAALRRVWRTGVQESLPVTVTGDGGKVIGWRRHAIYRLPNGDVVALYEDLTARKRAEARMKEIARSYQAVVRTANDGVVIIEADGTIKGWNRGAERLFGYKGREVIGRPVTMLMPARYREVHRRALAASLAKWVAGGRLLETVARRKGGVEFPVEISLGRWESDGRFYYAGFVRDIADRKAAEDKLRQAHRELRQRLEERDALFRSVKDAIVTVDPGLRLTAANAAAVALFGIDLNRHLGRPAVEVLTRCGDDVIGALARTVTQRRPLEEQQVRDPRDGRTFVLNTTPLTDEAGTFTGAVLVVRDISRMVGLEAELQQRYALGELVGKSEAMQRIYALIDDLRHLDTTVLITGESGVGKGMVARAIHYNGRRADRPLVTVNCSALAENLLESELFGHVRGAFTGAVSDRKGRFAAADGGTIILDEISDISPRLQLKLLRVIEEKTFERVGDSQPLTVDVQIIATANRDLRQMMQQGEFRQDLYYRLKVVEIHVPPLRQRLVDIPPLVAHYCRKFAARYDKPIGGVDDEVMERFMTYDWPGNVRELVHVLEAAFVSCRTPLITMTNLPPELQRPPAALSSSPSPADPPLGLEEALRRTGGNKSAAARLLGISRRTVYRRLARSRRSSS